MDNRHFLAICLNPTLQKTLVFHHLVRDEVNRAKECYLDASGKGVNVARVLAQLGERVVHLTHAGGLNKELWLSLVRRDGLEVSAPDSESDIRYCTTVIDAAEHTVTELVEEAVPVAPGTEERVIAAYRALLPATHTVIISGTRAGGYSKDLYARMVAEAKEAGCAVILDYRGDDLLASLPSRPDVIKPNFAEFLATWFPGSHESRDGDDPSLMARIADRLAELHHTYGVRTVLTRGSRDTIAWDGTRLVTVRTNAVQPVNTIGSGDAFTAGFAAKYHAGASFEDAIREGQRCGRLNASLIRPGVIR